MVEFGPQHPDNIRPPSNLFGQSAPKLTPQGKAKRKVFDFTRAMLSVVTKQDLKDIMKQMVSLAKTGNIKAAEWVVQQCTLTPAEQFKILETVKQQVVEAPKVILLDWRRQGLDAPQSP